MHKLCEKTQTTYIRALRKFAAYLKRSPVTLNAALTKLKFFFDNTLDCGELMARMQPVRVPSIPPVMLGREEVARLDCRRAQPKVIDTLNLPHQKAD